MCLCRKMYNPMRLFYTLLLLLLPLSLFAQKDSISTASSKKVASVHIKKGSVVEIKGHMTLRHIARHQAYSRRDSATYDTDIRSPKSVTLNPEGTRYYINSLEGHRTVGYDASTHQKLAHFGK